MRPGIHPAFYVVDLDKAVGGELFGGALAGDAVVADKGQGLVFGELGQGFDAFLVQDAGLGQGRGRCQAFGGTHVDQDDVALAQPCFQFLHRKRFHFVGAGEAQAQAFALQAGHPVDDDAFGALGADGIEVQFDAVGCDDDVVRAGGGQLEAGLDRKSVG